MEIVLDGQPHFPLQSNPDTVGSALLEINAYLQERGRALQAVSLDGRNVPADELTPEFGQRPVSRVQRLEVTSARTVDLVRESLSEVEAVLPELPVACQTLAGILAGDGPEEGRASFNQLLEVWDALRQRRVQVIDALGLDAGELALEGKSLRARETELGELLSRVRDAVAQGDHATASDLLAYELSTMAEQEASIISLLDAHCTDEA